MILKLQKSTNNKGETIAESLIALSILAIGITIAGMVMATSLQNVQGTRKRIVAINIAREGTEAVRNIRDTNWLKFSSNRRECWNHMPIGLENGNHDECSGSTAKIEPGTYWVYLDQNHQWRLQEDNENSEERFLSLVDIEPAVDSDKDGDPANDEDLYNHAMADAIGNAYAKKTIFTRRVNISYLDDDGDEGASADNRMKVEVTIEWFDKMQKTLTLQTLITDYLGRDDLTD